MSILRNLLLCSLAASAGALHAAERFLVENGEPRAEIVIAETPQRSVRAAAHDLREYVEKISGARLPIVTEPSGKAVKLFVGRSPHADKLGVTAEGLKYGAYRLVSGDDWLAFIGDDSDFVPREPWSRNNGGIAKLQADWEALVGEKWGVPNGGMYKNLVKLPGDTGLPDAAPPPGKSDTVQLWGFDERGSYNAVCGYLRSLGVRWYLPGELGEIVPQLKTLSLPQIDETVRPDFDLRRFNVRFGTCSPETVRWAMRLGMRDPHGLMVAHGMARMTDRKVIHDEHPDWFALFGGVRQFKEGSNNQLCYSNQELFEHTVRYCRAQFDTYDYESVSVMPPDGYTAMCQCPLCEGKGSPELGPRGSLSNHVWDFVNRVAKEVGKTHPDKLILCCAYGANTTPPSNIDKLEPNVQVMIVGGRRPKSGLAAREDIRRLREGWLAKTDRKIMIFENYPFTGRGNYLPLFLARSIGEGINETKPYSLGEDIWLTFGRDFDTKDVGFNHFQVYFTARMYWGGPNQDVGVMLDEYCRLFYGPAGEAMKNFFDYCEVHWPEMETDAKPIVEALALFDAAKSQVEASSTYGRRLALIDEFLDGSRRKSTMLAQSRGVVPKLRMVGDTDKTGPIVIDGKLDDEYWQKCPTAATGSLRELLTGRAPALGTTVKAGWSGNSVYFGIRCNERPGEPLNITATKREDAAIWYGDVVELLLTTDIHSYYQLVVNPAGALVDYDRAGDKSTWTQWDSQAEVATHVADDHWTIEIRIPVTDDENDPLHQIIGNKPTQSLPWFVNICRQRVRESGTEHSAFSPTGTNSFHEPMRFAHFYSGKSHTFDADPTATTFASQAAAAAKLPKEEAVAAYVALADGAQGKTADRHQSEALKRAVAAACSLKDYAKAEELSARIPIEAERKNAEMLSLLSQKKTQELIERFGDEDLTKWPFWAAADGYFARGRAYAALGDHKRARGDLQSARELTSDRQTLKVIDDALEKLSPE